MTATKVIGNIGHHRYFVEIMFLKCLQFTGKPIWSPLEILSHKESWQCEEKLSNIIKISWQSEEKLSNIINISWQFEEKLSNMINIGLTLIPYLCLTLIIQSYSSSFQKPGYISSSFPEEVSIIISLCCLISITTGHVSRGLNFTFYLVVFKLFYLLPEMVFSIIKLFSEKQILKVTGHGQNR